MEVQLTTEFILNERINLYRQDVVDQAIDLYHFDYTKSPDNLKY